jgi:hypothetical protein
MLVFAVVVVGLAMAVVALVMAASARRADRPAFVFEKAPLSKDLAALLPRVEKWRAEHRLSREEYEHLLRLVQEDSVPPPEAR